MKSSTLYTGTFILATASALPLAEHMATDLHVRADWPHFPNSTTGHVRTDGNGHVIFHQVLSTDDSALQRRATPRVCTWGGAHADYYYHYINDAGNIVPGKVGTLCIGWTEGLSTGNSCSKPWGATAQTNIKQSMSQQIQKDGFTKSTTVGEWFATWNSDFTTAFHDSTPEIWVQSFNRVFNNFDGADRSKTYVSAQRLDDCSQIADGSI